MRIVQFATRDVGGGAELVARNLHRAYQNSGHESWLMVGYQDGPDAAGVKQLDRLGTRRRPLLSMLEDRVAQLRPFRGQRRLRVWLRRTSHPTRWLDRWRGIDYRAGQGIDEIASSVPEADVIQLHNLHGEYFDLRCLPTLTKRLPVVWTLHDAWVLTGHCAHFSDIACERWRSGCGSCPDLRRAPGVLADATAVNWQAKRSIYRNSRLLVATPSKWLMRYVGDSILTPSQTRVIPNGVNLGIFVPTPDRSAIRVRLNLPLDAFVCVFIAAGGARSSYKDWATVHRAIMRLRDGSKTDIVGVCIGGSNRPYESQGIRYTGYLTDQRHVAAYMQAADVLLYAARSDNSPCVIPEALACGLPVIATDVGGIGELIDDGRTGFLVPAGDAGALATRARQVLTSPSLLHRMRATAAETARTRFGLDRQASAYLEWFEALRHGVTS